MRNRHHPLSLLLLLLFSSSFKIHRSINVKRGKESIFLSLTMISRFAEIPGDSQLAQEKKREKSEKVSMLWKSMNKPIGKFLPDRKSSKILDHHRPIESHREFNTPSHVKRKKNMYICIYTGKTWKIFNFIEEDLL